MLEAICYREIVQFVAGATIETETEEGLGGQCEHSWRGQGSRRRRI